MYVKYILKNYYIKTSTATQTYSLTEKKDFYLKQQLP